MPKHKNLSKAIASRERTGKGAPIKRNIAQKEKRKYDELYNEVAQESLRFNRRIREYEGFLNQANLGRDQDFARRDLQRYQRGLEMRNEYLDQVQTKRTRLQKVVQQQSLWTDSLLSPLPIPRPITHSNPRRPHSPGPMPREVFRSIPIESREELQWLGPYGIHGFVASEHPY